MNKEQQRVYFSEHLLEWFRAYQRDLPWRRTKNPYHIWVSEIMLQQTQVNTVIPYFERFIEQFPTVEALAEAPEDAVLKAWEGLGYYSRARNLQTAVKEVKASYNGQVPSTKAEISSLKGVGPYTSGAILSIAFNQSEPAVDGNVMRVLSRYFLIEEDVTKGSTKAYMERLIVDMIPAGTASDFNQGLMELGALVCTPKSPQCLTCPVMEHCQGRIEGKEEQLPIKKKAKAPRPEQHIAALIEGSGELKGRILIRQRPDEGLLAKMWELPHITLEPSMWNLPDDHNNELLQAELKQAGLTVKPKGWWMDTEHTFSHIHWQMRVYRYESSQVKDLIVPERYRWASLDEVDQSALPNVFLRILKQYRKET
jgi:A/G-specific adenine glycosylase